MSSSNRRQQKRPIKLPKNEPKVIEVETTPPNKKFEIAECSNGGLQIRIVKENVDLGNDVPRTGDPMSKYIQNFLFVFLFCRNINKL